MGAGRDLYALRRDGTEFPVEISLSPLVGDQGPLVCAIVVDISERQRSEARFRAALGAMTDRFYLLEGVRDEAGRFVDFRVVDANAAAVRGAERAPEGVVGCLFSQLTPAHGRDELFASYAAVIEERRPSERTIATGAPGARVRWVRQQLVPVPPSGLAILAQDVTEAYLAYETSARLAAIVESTDDAIISETLDGVATTWNRAAERIFGYRADEMIGRPLSALVPPHRRDDHAETLGRLRSGAPGAHYETVRRRKDGRDISVSVTATVIRDARGDAVTASEIVRDITAKKAAEDAIRASLKEKEALLQEVHHRVKNNLQVIASLINMQLRKIEDAPARAALEECQTRVLAIALIHEKLYQSNDQGRVPFHEYLQGLARSIFQAAGASPDDVRLELDVERVTLPMDTAIPCGLLVNELMTNALKHAFPQGRRGTLRVELAARGGWVRLRVSDDGVGLPASFDLNRSQGLGLQLVVTLAEQLEATVESEPPPGAAFRVTFALDEEVRL